MSNTKSASRGTPYLKPNDITAMRSRGPASFVEDRRDLLGQLVDVQARGVDDDVGVGAQVLEQARARARSRRAAGPRPAAGAGGARSRTCAPAPRRWRRGTPGSAASRGSAARRASRAGAVKPRARTSTTAAMRGMPSAPWRFPASSVSGTSRCGGRLSTTYQPESSRTLAVVVRPAPLMPVTMTSSVRSGAGRAPVSVTAAPPSSMTSPVMRLTAGAGVPSCDQLCRKTAGQCRTDAGNDLRAPRRWRPGPSSPSRSAAAGPCAWHRRARGCRRARWRSWPWTGAGGGT